MSFFVFFSSRRRHTRFSRDWSSDVCSSDLVEEQRLLTAEAAGHSDEQAAYLRRMDQIGWRVAELQVALASRDDIAAFAPEPIAADDVGNWTEGILQRAGRALGDLARRRSELAENDRQLLDALS